MGWKFLLLPYMDLRFHKGPSNFMTVHSIGPAQFALSALNVAKPIHPFFDHCHGKSACWNDSGDEQEQD